MLKNLVFATFIFFIQNVVHAQQLDYSKYYSQLTVKSPKAIVYDADTGHHLSKKG